MKKALIIIMSVLALGLAEEATSQIVVVKKPRKCKVVKRPVSRPGQVWVAGYWKSTPRGRVWVAGHWRKVRCR